MKNVEHMVRRILIDYPETRDDDNKLYAKCVKVFYPDQDCLVSEIGYTQDVLPSYESVSRVRRKLQEKEENLQSSIPCRRNRARRREEVKGWALGNG